MAFIQDRLAAPQLVSDRADHPPPQTLHWPVSGVSRTSRPVPGGTGAWPLGMSQATPLPPSCRVFLRAGALPRVGSAPGRVSGARRAAEEGRCGFEDDRKALPGRGGRALSSLPPRRHPGLHGPPAPAVEGWEGDCCYLPSQEPSAQARLAAGRPLRPQHVALWAQ